MENTILKAAQVRPLARQLAWQETEFYAFVHFSPNTFTNMEWGLGNEDPSIFNPTALNARQWVAACKSAGMRGLILTCKHFDRVVLMEHIASSGQRIELFTLEYEDAGQWRPFFHGTVVGYKKICVFNMVKSGALRLKIEQSRVCPTLSYFGVFNGKGG